MFASDANFYDDAGVNQPRLIIVYNVNSGLEIEYASSSCMECRLITLGALAFTGREHTRGGAEQLLGTSFPCNLMPGRGRNPRIGF